MATYNTGNALGSTDPRDLLDNAENLDKAVNSEIDTWVDRLGNTRRTMAGIDQDANKAMLAYGYVTKRSFTLGNTLSNPNEVLYNEGDGEYYRWDGSLPKVVPAGSTPEAAGGIGGGEWVSVGDAALRGDLIKAGASISGLKQGGTVQNAIAWVTLENLGYDPSEDTTADVAFGKWVSGAKAGTLPCQLMLSPDTRYPLTTPVTLDFPHAIRGLSGANYLNTDQTTGSSGFIDARSTGQTEFLITVANPTGSTLVGWTWEGFAFWGEYRQNPGVLFTAAGWAQALTRIAFWNIRHTALATVGTNDGTYVDIFFGACGGITSDGVVRYAYDMAPYVDGLVSTGQSSYTNCSVFYRPHFEYCRYAVRIQAHSLHFHGAHIESGAVTSYAAEFSPMINVYKLGGGVTFHQGNLSDAGWELYLSSVTATADTASSYIAQVPAMVGTTNADSSDLNANGQYYSYVTFSGVEYNTYKGYGKFVNLPNTQVNIVGKCQLKQLMTFAVPVIVGPYSTIDSSSFYAKVTEITDTTDDYYVYASAINNKFGNVYQIASGWGAITHNTFFGFKTANITANAAAGIIDNPAVSIVHGNKQINYTADCTAYSGSHIFGGIDVRSMSDSTDRASYLPSVLNVQKPSYTFQFPNNYTNAKVQLLADTNNGIILGPNTASGKSSLGSSSAYWSNGYFGTAPTTVSDENEKTDISELSDAEITCALACAKLYRKYKLNSAVANKGESEARYHIGTIAQYVIQAFTEAGLDWKQYGIVTYESWDATEAITDADGVEITPAKDAGEIYMVRYDEFNSFVMAGLVSKM